MTFPKEGDHMCRLVFAAVTLITIHTLCKDLATEEVSTRVNASSVPPRSLAVSAPKSIALRGTSLRRVQTSTAGMSNYDQISVSVLGERDCIMGSGKEHDIFDPRYQ